MVFEMTSKEAAVSLNESLSRWKWFRMVGIGADDEGREQLVVYVRSVNKSAKETVPDSWNGFQVRIAGMSDPKTFGKKKALA